jgi:MerR HTH family regulatory protein
VDTESWTLDELARRAGQALAADAVQAPNGRVRERPDGRAIRWYATIGLVDRPLVGPGRTARYGPRHLLQLVAVKRLQALGLSLAQIQAELTGATDATLRRVARLPHDPALPHDSTLQHDSTSPHDPALPRDTDTDTDTSGEAAPAPAPARFWATAPARTAIAAPAAKGEPPRGGEPVTMSYALALSGTVSLTLPHPPDAADLEAIREAAAPLLRLLADRGLTPVESDPS